MSSIHVSIIVAIAFIAIFSLFFFYGEWSYFFNKKKIKWLSQKKLTYKGVDITIRVKESGYSFRDGAKKTYDIYFIRSDGARNFYYSGFYAENIEQHAEDGLNVIKNDIDIVKYDDTSIVLNSLNRLSING